MSATTLPVVRCLAPCEEGDGRDEDYCDLYEASEIGSPCEECYFTPCKHGKTSGCQEPCANCPEPCWTHWGVGGLTGATYRGCMGPDGEDSKACPCEAFVDAPAPPTPESAPETAKGPTE